MSAPELTEKSSNTTSLSVLTITAFVGEVADLSTTGADIRISDPSTALENTTVSSVTYAEPLALESASSCETKFRPPPTLTESLKSFAAASVSRPLPVFASPPSVTEPLNATDAPADTEASSVYAMLTGTSKTWLPDSTSSRSAPLSPVRSSASPENV